MHSTIGFYLFLYSRLFSFSFMSYFVLIFQAPIFHLHVYPIMMIINMTHRKYLFPSTYHLCACVQCRMHGHFIQILNFVHPFFVLSSPWYPFQCICLCYALSHNNHVIFCYTWIDIPTYIYIPTYMNLHI